MRKRVLLAEESDAVRGVAESVLRQNGFEVIAVSTGAKALEVLNFTRPDVMVVGSNLEGTGRKQLFENIQQDPKSASVPLLVLSEHDETGLPFHEEAIIPKPFDPRQFIAKIHAYMGQPVAKQVQSVPGSANPLGSTELDDQFLDAALGLDNISVTDSEIMNKTGSVSVPGKKPSREHMIGLVHESDRDDASDTGRVESLMISDEENPPAKPPPHSDTGGLDILDDQYGLIDPAAAQPQAQKQSHDYDWFVNEMRKDGTEAKPGGKAPRAKSEKHHGDSDSGLQFTDPSSIIDPVTPATTSAPSPHGGNPSRTQGVDKFIDEFKKEVEKIQSSEPDSITLGVDGQKQAGGKKGTDWEDSLERLTPEQMSLFTRQFVTELADRIAQKIADKIDSEKLLRLISNEILRKLDEQSRL